MSTESLTKDPTRAAEILAALGEKDQNETVCRYPTCDLPRTITTGSGRPSAYCDNPDHNAVSNHRARASLRTIATGATATTPKREASPPTVMVGGAAPVETLRASIVNRIVQLQSDMERYLTTLAEIADPDAAAAQIQTTLDRAEARIAEAQQNASSERALRLAADTTRLAAQTEANAEREAAEQAIQRMEEIEERLQRQKEDFEQQIAEMRSAHEQALTNARTETQKKIQTIEKQSLEAVTLARAATTKAQEETKLATAKAHEAETTAHAQVAAAEQLLAEARVNLDRERSEVDRLRKEHAEAVTNMRTQAEAERSQARIDLDRERGEVDQLRKELATLRTRADQLLATNEKLQTDLVQFHLKEYAPRPEKK